MRFFLPLNSHHHEAEPRDYLSAVIDDPIFAEPIRTAMFEDNGKLAMVWRRKG